MALRRQDKELIETTARSLRRREALSENCSYVGSDQYGEGENADFLPQRPNNAVVITKDDLRSISGRSHVRESYQNELVAGLNSQIGVSAQVIDGNIYAMAVPIHSFQEGAVPLSTLIEEGNNARDYLVGEEE